MQTLYVKIKSIYLTKETEAYRSVCPPEKTVQMNDQKSETYQKLITAFSDSDFQSEINQYRYAIEQELGKFIEWLLTELDPQKMIFRSPESRIKSRSGKYTAICAAFRMKFW